MRLCSPALWSNFISKQNKKSVIAKNVIKLDLRRGQNQTQKWLISLETKSWLTIPRINGAKPLISSLACSYIVKKTSDKFCAIKFWESNIWGMKKMPKEIWYICSLRNFTSCHQPLKTSHKPVFWRYSKNWKMKQLTSWNILNDEWKPSFLSLIERKNKIVP